MGTENYSKDWPNRTRTQMTPRRRDAHWKLTLVQAPFFSLSTYFHPSSTTCLHIFRYPRFCFNYSLATQCYLHSRSFLPSENKECPPFLTLSLCLFHSLSLLFLYVKRCMHTCTCQQARNYFRLRLQAKFARKRGPILMILHTVNQRHVTRIDRRNMSDNSFENCLEGNFRIGGEFAF